MHAASHDELARFRFLHDMAQRVPLPPEECDEYAHWKEALAAGVCRARGISVPAAASARQHFSVPTVLRVELGWTADTEKTTTLDVSTRGFVSIVGAARAPGTRARCRLFLLRGDPIAALVAVEATQSARAGGPHRMTLRFLELKAPERDRLENALYDALARQSRGGT